MEKRLINNNIQPIIINGRNFNLKEIKRKFKIKKIIDVYSNFLEDLFLIRNPKYRFNKENFKEDFKNFFKKLTQKKDAKYLGKWIYYPYDQTLIHSLEEKLFLEVLTARNKNLITKKEQEKFYKAKIGVAGLSVGSHAAITIARMGGGKFMKLADPDTIDPSNLNRINFGINNIGANKAIATAQTIWSINPYSNIELYIEGINQKNFSRFLDNLDILIEELDDIELKWKIREEARKRRIPVVMATDNGDSVIMDIERFDLEPKRSIFHGNLKNFDINEIKQSPKKLFQAIAKIIDIKLVPSRVLESVMEVGKTLYSWPQLCTAASISGAITAYIVRKIILEKKILSGKYVVDLEKIFNTDYKKFEKERKEAINKFLKFLK